MRKEEAIIEIVSAFEKAPVAQCEVILIFAQHYIGIGEPKEADLNA